jgi:chemotaxis protein methyltransferase CheR
MDFYARGKDLFLSEASDDAPLRNEAFRYEIDAFDINPGVIEIARSGRFSGNTLREDGAEWRVITDLYLKIEGREHKVAQFLCDKVRFCTPNIMDGLKSTYDIIFFRNALIYFSPENRLKILDSLVNALTEGGILILGVSETSSIEHPLLESKHTQSAFYFQKKGKAKESPARTKSEPVETSREKSPPVETLGRKSSPIETPREKSSPAEAPRGKSSQVETPREKSSPAEAPLAEPRIRRTSGPSAGRSAPLDLKEIAALLEHLEGRPNAQKTTDALEQGEDAEALTESGLIAAALTFLGAEEAELAEKVIAFLENKSGAAAVSFLRAEYCCLTKDLKIAEEKYQEAALVDRMFWPAFYRLSSLAAEGNRTRYEYKIKKALESMDAGKDIHYELFIGGFSPDYYRRILERKLTE